MRFLASLTFSSLLFSAACTGGERNQTGECPADEECSPLTPYGMHFTGVPLAGGAGLAHPKVTAVGGTQTIDLWVEDRLGDIDPLGLPFAANADNGNAIAIAGTAQDVVIVEGIGAGGDDYLRIAEPDTDLLYDRFELESRPLDRLGIIPATAETYDASAALAFYQGDVAFAIALYDAADGRLADDSMQVTVDGPAPLRSEWDSFELQSLAPGTLTMNVTAAGMTGPLDLEIVGALDAVAPLTDSFPPTIVVGDSGTLCFEATAGTFSVIGAPWTFQMTGPASSIDALGDNCFGLQTNAPGTVSVTAMSLGQSAQVDLEVVAQAAGKRAPAPPAAPLPDVRGERARLVTR
jgi:hypothetical protein